MDVTIREYEPRDRAAFVECMDRLQRHLAAADPLRLHTTRFEDRVKYTDWLFSQIESREGMALMALAGDEVVGCAAGFLEPLSDEDRLDLLQLKPARVQDLYVHEAYRGRGIGALLMQRLEAHFQAKGCDLLRVGAFAPNARSIAFYEREGYMTYGVELLKRIP